MIPNGAADGAAYGATGGQAGGEPTGEPAGEPPRQDRPERWTPPFPATDRWPEKPPGKLGVIEAAGCVLWRPLADGNGIELALVHRPKYADWSYPKGKLKRGEQARQAAVREVREETGMTCLLGAELGEVHYRVADRPKRVRYWAAEAVGGEFVPNREVDRVAWLGPEEARERLTMERDRDLVPLALAALGMERPERH